MIALFFVPYTKARNLLSRGLADAPALPLSSEHGTYTTVKSRPESDLGSSRKSFLFIQIVPSSLGSGPTPRLSVGGGKFIQNRLRSRFPLVQTNALRGKLTFGDTLSDSGSEVVGCVLGGVSEVEEAETDGGGRGSGEVGGVASKELDQHFS